MKKALNHLLLLVALLLAIQTNAQQSKITGLWEVQKVAVGEKSMTPVAKWFKINNDGTYQAGNGWLQNGQGKWSYDAKTNLYSAADDLDIADEFGGFNVSFDQDNMLWEREEEGMRVKITLVPVGERPMSPADYLEGIWDLVEITENGNSILAAFDGEGNHKLFIRWDRVYINFSPEKQRLTGYWHIHGHKPEITLMPHQEGTKPESWRVEVNTKALLMTGISDSNRNIQRKYVRRKTF